MGKSCSFRAERCPSRARGLIAGKRIGNQAEPALARILDATMIQRASCRLSLCVCGVCGGGVKSCRVPRNRAKRPIDSKCSLAPFSQRKIIITHTSQHQRTCTEPTTTPLHAIQARCSIRTTTTTSLQSCPCWPRFAGGQAGKKTQHDDA